MHRRRRWVVALIGIGLVGCSSGSGSDAAGPSPSRRDGTVSSTTLLSQNPCALTNVNDIEAAFGAVPDPIPGRANCRFRIPERGQVRFSSLPADTTTLREIAPSGRVIEDLGDEAQWSPRPDERGGVLYVRTGSSLLVFDAHVDGDPDVTASQTVGWARDVLARLGEGKGDGAAPTRAKLPATAVTDPCRLLTPRDASAIFGEDAQRKAQAGTCTYETPAGSLVTVGPLTRPASPDALAHLGRTSTVDGKQVAWPATKVAMSDGGLLLKNPTIAGDVAIYVVQGAELLRVAVTADDPKAAENLAIVTAKAVFDNR